MFAGAPASPGDADWAVWVGTSIGANTWRLIPDTRFGYKSDLSGTWTVFNNGSAEMSVEACSRDCGPFTPGTTINFTQLWTQSGGGVPPIGDVRPGTYSADTTAFEACLHVSPDGTRLTSNGSGCNNGNSLDIDLEEGTSSLGGECNANVNISEPVQIVNNRFTKQVTISNPYFRGAFTVTGTFSGNTVTGTFSGEGDYIPGVCSGNWSASL